MSSVYDIDRIETPPAPPGFKDDVADIHFVPAPCQVACPIGTDAPSYIGYIWEGRIKEAFEAITATNPLSSICGRVCDAPCEPACRRADSDGAIAIRNLKRFVMDKLGKDFAPTPVAVSRKQSVGIVGGGPAGLTAAQDLAEAGFAVDLYELTDRLGGMASWGIPAFRLPVGIIKEDIDRLLKRCPGIKVHFNCMLGRDVTLEELKKRHEAVLLTIGSWWGKKLGVPGDDLPKVVDGVGFLRRVNGGERPQMPETVLVVGGGDVAMDACRAVRRLPGCKKVTIVYRRGAEEIPARKEELAGAIEEGIKIVYNTQPVSVVEKDGSLVLRCVTTRMGKPGPDGRRSPENVPGSEHDIACGLVIAAVGQQAESDELGKAGLMAKDRVKTDWASMRTKDAKVFAAGDGAFGGSTLVKAMFHGHRAAYYIRNFIDGIAEPLPYRTPYRTRRVPVAQDPDWEIFNRFHQEFHGLGKNPVAFPEIESTYSPDEARKEAARCFRCDAETGSSDYNVHTREEIFVMARTAPDDAKTQLAILEKRLESRSAPFPKDHKPSLDDLVFLPANLSRLVIDPYRDACNMKVRLAARVDLELPFLATGFDEAPEEIRKSLAKALADVGSAYVGRRSLGGTAPWLQLIVGDKDKGDAKAAAWIYAPEGGFKPFDAAKAPEGMLTGLVARAGELEQAIPFALERGFDILLVDASAGIAGAWPELKAYPDFTAIRDALKIMRRMNREEDLTVLYFGGIRTGTDGAKLIGLGAPASIVGVGMALAMGGEIDGASVRFNGDRHDGEREDAAASLLRALAAEASIMARCTGKTDVRNIEPEDLRAITLATAKATGIPLAGAQKVQAKKKSA